MSTRIAKPPYDTELETTLASLAFPSKITVQDILPMRSLTNPCINDLIAGRAVSHEEWKILGPHNDLTVSILQQSGSSATASSRPGILYIHGGGMIAGTRFLGVEFALDWVISEDAVCVTVEYRLSPEHPDPAPIEDCYAALMWMNDQAEALGIDSSRLIVAGGSAGGGLAAGVALLSRDRGVPNIHAQLLMAPMLDDRNQTISCQQYAYEGSWTGASNETGWACLLGDKARGSSVSIYAAPSRAADLSRLPPAFIDVGSAEVFRDEVVAYASRLWACGGQAELHVWPGGWHGFDLLAPSAALSVVARSTRSGWVRRMLSR